jgi:hypothetical protein
MRLSVLAHSSHLEYGLDYGNFQVMLGVVRQCQKSVEEWFAMSKRATQLLVSDQLPPLRRSLIDLQTWYFFLS